MKKSIVLLLLSIGFISCSKNRNLPYDSAAFKEHVATQKLEAAKKEEAAKALKIKEEAEKAEVAKAEAIEKELLAEQEAKISIPSEDETREQFSKMMDSASEKIEATLLSNEEVVSDLQVIMNNQKEISAGTFDVDKCTESIRLAVQKNLSEKIDVKSDVNVTAQGIKTKKDEAFVGPVQDDDVELNIEIAGKNFKYLVSELLKK